jgi:hypothetical protein
VSRFAGKTFRVCISRKKNSPPRRRAVLVDLYVFVSARLRLLLRHPNERLPTFSEEVGFGRRERGDINELYILGGILPLTSNMSMEKRHEF